MDIGGTGAGKEVLKLGDRSTSDVIVRVGTPGRDCSFYAHSAVLAPRSSYLAASLAKGNSIRLGCCEEDFNYYVILLRLFYAMQGDFSSTSCSIVAEECYSVKTTIGVTKVATDLGCEAIVEKCFQFLEGVPWNEGEEEEMIKALSAGICSSDDPVLARLRSVDSAVVREVFLSAIIAATRDQTDAGLSIKRKAAAQEQIEYMLVEDDDSPLITSDCQIKSVFREKFCELFQRFKDVITIEGSGVENFEGSILEKLADVAWASRVMSRLSLLAELVSAWSDFSLDIVCVFQDPSLSSGIKLKVMEITSKVLEAVGYGSVLIPPTQRTGLLKAWLPFVRHMKMVLLEAECVEETIVLYNNIEAAINSLVLSLPSDDQGVILAQWLKNESASYPDLSEAFEVWCFRSKAAKRRLNCG